MGPLDAFWHALHLILPALLTATVAAGLSKLLWRDDLRKVSWARLSVWGAGAGALALVGGLVLFGRDGRMASYGVMILCNAIALGWVGWGQQPATRTSASPRPRRR